jgi:hypothetical protein
VQAGGGAAPEAVARVEQAEDAGCTQPGQGLRGASVGQDQVQLGGQPLARQGWIGAEADGEGLGARRPAIRQEAQARAVTRRPEDTRRVLHEGQGMKDLETAAHEVPPAPVGIQQLEVSGAEFDGHGVDREVPACEVLADRRRHHTRQGSGRLVALRARGGHIHATPLGPRD